MGAIEVPGGNPRQVGKPLSSKEKRVMRLIEQGVTAPVEIAEHLRIKRSYARVLLCKLRKKGLHIPYARPISLEPIRMMVAGELAEDVRKYAKTKGTTATALIHRIILVITKENLFDAIIDED